ncbi:F0F1 ATP synthase subunit B [Streptococcus parauberis]|uniref:ATP synthase subunit b n=3 Tax=Streptococcus parauberis TaxID=1348 RepID=F1YYC4_9STRE|nr:F0F1 ATP synthase subunit B [Streptococcus parauberis]AEF24944.1 ATP synthase B chain [Streptococcus parauberis KCTC 11537]EGE53307.1 ATP synthase F0, B subunit [Streptococcus parauberis NCFD 2020]EMG26194.1 ATP synthase B chain [Streptococcus parauberis KRS-02083]KYP16718.1 ATP synthase subunit b [Streptococcus parauberis]KYP18483.1 ATP synthase subunit b [Streptococcus parauberis]
MELTVGELIGNFILVTGSILVLYLLLKKFAWGQISGILDERAAKISNDIDKAENARINAENLQVERQKELDGAKSEASQIIVDAKEIGQAQSTKLIEEANDEASRLKEKADIDIERSKAEALSDVKNQMSDLSISLAEKIIGANLDKDAQSKLIDSYLNDLGEA